MHSRRPHTFCALLLLSTLGIGGCIKARPPIDAGDPLVPTGPSSTSGSGATGTSTPTGPFAYEPDMRTLFVSDCVACHGGFRVDGKYRMTTYQEVMKDVRPGDAASRLVVWTQSRGSMYRYFSGNRQAKADMVTQWVVTYKAQQTK